MSTDEQDPSAEAAPARDQAAEEAAAASTAEPPPPQSPDPLDAAPQPEAPAVDAQRAPSESVAPESVTEQPPTQPPPPPPSWSSPVQPPTPQPGFRYDVPQDQKNLAMLSTIGMVVVGFLSPLIVFAITNGDPAKRFANDHAKEGLNFSIVMLVASVVTVLLSFLIIGFLIIPLLAGWGLWVVIAGTIQASNGEAPHYPLVPKILK